MIGKLINTLLLFTLLLLVAMGWFLPEIVHTTLPRLAAQDGLNLSIGQVEDRYSSSQLILHDVVFGAGQEIRLERVQLELDTWSLLTGILRLREVNASGGDITLHIRAGQGLLPGRVQNSHLAELLSLFRFSKLTLSDIRVHSGDGYGSWKISSAILQSPYLDNDVERNQFLLQAHAPGGKVDLDGSWHPVNGQHSFSGELRLGKLDLSPVEGFRQGMLSMDVTFETSVTLEDTSIAGRLDGQMILHEAELDDGSSLQDANWRGQALLRFGQDNGPDPLELRGHLLLDEAKFHDAAQLTSSQLSNVDFSGEISWHNAFSHWHQVQLAGDTTLSGLQFENRQDGYQWSANGLQIWGASYHDRQWHVGHLDISSIDGKSDDVSWKGSNMQLDKVVSVSGGPLTIASLESERLRLNEQQDTPVYIKHVQAGGLAITSHGQTIENVRLTHLYWHNRHEVLARSSAEEVLLLDVQNQPGNRGAGKIQFDGLQVDAVRNAATDWVLPGLSLFRSPGFSITQLELTGKNSLTFSDYSVEPRVRINLQDIQGHYTRTTGKDGMTAASARVSALSGNKGIVALQAMADHGTEPESGWRIRATIENIELLGLSGYLQDYYNTRVYSGELNAAATLEYEQQSFQGNADIDLRRTLLEPASGQDKPLYHALRLVENHGQGIHLSLPLPFTLSDINQYLQQTACAHYAELDISLHDCEQLLNSGSQALPLQLSAPLLTPSHKQYLQQLAALMKQYPASRLYLCPYVSQGQDGMEHRHDLIRDFLLTHTDLSPSRLLACQQQDAMVTLTVQQ